MSRRWGAPRATYLNDIFHGAEEGWVAMEVDFPVLRFVPFAVEKQIFGEQQLLNLPGVVLWTIRNGNRVIRRHVFVINPLSDFIFVVVLDVSRYEPPSHSGAICNRSTSFGSALVEIRLTVLILWQFLQYQQPCQAFRSSEASLEDSWIDAGTIE